MGPFWSVGTLDGVIRPLSGVYAAAPTPLTADYAPALGDVAALLTHLRRVGCHGALVLGTTGEGPSFGLEERRAILEAAAAWRAEHPDFRLLAGTGCAALTDAAALTRSAVELGYDGQVVLPPFYFKAVANSGLVEWYLRLADAVGEGSRILVYHIPAVSGVAVPVEVVAALRDAAPTVFVGVKDSSGDLVNAKALCQIPGLAVFTGTDSHLAECLGTGGAGSITALANVCGTLARKVFEGGTTEEAAALEAARLAFERYPSVAAVKGLLHHRFSLPLWPLCPPLRDLPREDVLALSSAIDAAMAPTAAVDPVDTVESRGAPRTP